MEGMKRARGWFKERGFEPFSFQEELWSAYLNQQSALLTASTGTGKTYAAWFGPLIENMNSWGDKHLQRSVTAQTQEPLDTGPPNDSRNLPLTVLWITPLRALAQDLHLNLLAPVQDLKLPFSVETRTSDTSAGTRARQKKVLPSCLITTPESISIQISYAGFADKFRHVKLVVVDEWHELLGSKRGTLVELFLARLRSYCSPVVFALSATIGNADLALETLVPSGDRIIITGKEKKVIEARSVLPPRLSNLPWSGHTGLTMVDEVAKLAGEASSTLIFTNTRSQTEQWYQELIEIEPDFAGRAALHHGSLDTDVRRFVEENLRSGRINLVVSTSSLDLGVDFSPVERVLQIGSPKSVARALQRAGRSGHRPGAVSTLYMVPCHALELVELAAARIALTSGHLEERYPVLMPIDVLCQHITTTCLAGPLYPQQFLKEMRSTRAFRHLSEDELNWSLTFVATGGSALAAYPEFKRIKLKEGYYEVDCETAEGKQLALKHRLSIGTIVADQSMEVRFFRGGSLGHVEESFISRLKVGDTFLFAGRYLELVEVNGMKAYVRLSSKRGGPVPRWMGGRLPMSSQLSAHVRYLIDQASHGKFEEPEMTFIKPLLLLQSQRSLLPAQDEVLVEWHKSRDGYHLFIYTFEGRMVNEGLAYLSAFKLSRLSPATFSIAVNDWGFEILSDRPFRFERGASEFFMAFKQEELSDDILACLNAGEMARRQFREIARVGGLIFQGYPGAPRKVKQVQISSSLLYDVFVDYDPGNLLVRQAHQEVLDRHLEVQRMKLAIERIVSGKVVEVETPKASPFALPLMVDRLRGKLSSEKLSSRIERMEVDMAREMQAGRYYG
ncbi:MAG: ligase-associated DNA damage response DEXH box helicase [Candidatus Obscuribacter sp.]|nr:ligase-associated DNA damage response DEXH box helicase [Candidatus Obscuribacter sp.]MBK9278102.1 ligase-associated DNA damage response DEXH box helicase [Candidatus Obscuribacter sp.]